MTRRSLMRSPKPNSSKAILNECSICDWHLWETNCSLMLGAKGLEILCILSLSWWHFVEHLAMWYAHNVRISLTLLQVRSQMFPAWGAILRFIGLGVGGRRGLRVNSHVHHTHRNLCSLWNNSNCSFFYLSLLKPYHIISVKLKNLLD